MNFGQRLKALLYIFNLNSRKLASAIHVDPSSVSRWINNKRTLPPNTLLVDKIVDYILNLDSLNYQKDQFYQLISPNSDISTANSVQLAKKIKEWLFTPSESIAAPVKETVQNDGNKLNEIQIKELLINIKKYTNKTNNVTKFESVNKISDVILNTGDKKTVEVFHGKEGIHQSMLRLAVSLLQQNQPGEILITCPDNFIWFKEIEFMNLWMDLMSEILKKGHSIKIIYNLACGLPEVMYLIQKWLPLLTMGNIDAFYYPKYEFDLICTTIIVVPGIGCVHSILSEDESTHGSTFLYTDYGITEYFKNKYNKLVLSAKKLVYTFSSSNILSLHEELSMIERNPGFRFVFRNGLTSLTLPLTLYKNLLKKSSLTKSQQQKRLSLQKLRLEILKSKGRSAIYRDICPLEALEEMTNNTCYEYSLIDIFSNGFVKADAYDMIEHLKNTIEMLENNDNYEIALVSGNEIFGKNTMYLALKEDTAALVSSWDSDGNSLCLLIKENMVVHAFEEFFKRTWEQIPRVNRDKTWVIGKLQTKITHLERTM